MWFGIYHTDWRHARGDRSRLPCRPPSLPKIDLISMQIRSTGRSPGSNSSTRTRRSKSKAGIGDEVPDHGRKRREISSGQRLARSGETRRAHDDAGDDRCAVKTPKATVTIQGDAFPHLSCEWVLSFSGDARAEAIPLPRLCRPG